MPLIRAPSWTPPSQLNEQMPKSVSLRTDSAVSHSFNFIMTESLLRWTVDKLKHSFGLEASDDIVQ